MMTKNTSRKITLLKKITVVPILAILIYFFCIEIVAQEKIINNPLEKKVTDKNIIDGNIKINEKDKIRDSYYSGVYVMISNKKNNRSDVTLYENLSLEDKRKYLDFIPEMMIVKEIPKSLFEKMTRKNMPVWINGKVKTKDEIKKYKRTDFSYYTYTFVQKNAPTENFTHEYQYTLYTKDFFDENLKNSHLHFKGDTIKINYGSFNSAIENPIIKHSKADKAIWPSKEKNNYNLYVKEKKEKKVIVIDAGHGGKDSGNKIDDEFESKIVESIAKKISLLNTNDEIEIILLREDDTFIGLRERVNMINKINPNLLISLHVNSSKDIEENGVDAYISKKNNFYEKSFQSAESLVDHISNKRLSKGAVKDGDFFLISQSNCPSVLLEVGYLSNKNDKTYLTSETGKNEIANRIYEFIKN